MRLRWHVLKSALFCNLAVFVVFALTVLLLFESAKHNPGFVLTLLSAVQPIASLVLDGTGELGAFARTLDAGHLARLDQQYAKLGLWLYSTAIFLGILFGVFYQPLYPRFLALTTRLLGTDQRTAAKIERDALDHVNRIGTILIRILLPLYFIYVSDIGSRFGNGAAIEAAHHEVSSQLLFFCLMTYLLSATFFSGLFGLLRRVREPAAE